MCVYFIIILQIIVFVSVFWFYYFFQALSARGSELDKEKKSKSLVKLSQLISSRCVSKFFVIPDVQVPGREIGHLFLPTWWEISRKPPKKKKKLSECFEIQFQQFVSFADWGKKNFFSFFFSVESQSKLRVATNSFSSFEAKKFFLTYSCYN